MRPTIGRWHTRYRVAGGAGTGAVRLENGVRERVAESYAAALEQVFGDDPAVYVLRRVQTELTVVNPSMADEPAIARVWGHRACAEVVRTVMRHGDDASLVMRFDDTAAFVAQWIADLLDGVAWDRWYYGAFAAYRGLSVEEAIRRALIDYRLHLPAILRRVPVPLLLSRLPPDVAREVWQVAVRGETRDEVVSGEQFRLFVRTAFEIADALDAWIVERPVLDEVLTAYRATSPVLPDWKQPRALAEAVFAVLAFLERRAFVRIVSFSALPLASLEWLDVEWLSASLEAWARGTSPEVIASRTPALTALQQRILFVLRSLVPTIALPDGLTFTERNALAVFAALAAAEPLLAAHAATAAPMIERVLADVSGGAAGFSPPEAGGLKARRSTSTQTITSAYAGIFLLTRAILEARVAQLAEAYGIHVPTLLRQLANEWACDPEDAGVIFWSGSEKEEEIQSEALRQEVLRFMRDRAAFAPSLDPADDASIATCLVRLWTAWLPRLGHSSVEWVLGQFILRRGVIRVDEDAIEVALAPAPLDVVLEMAGYLAPIAGVPWLGDRRVAFVIDRSLA